jgi:short-subunit dehydrogenase involved in D-alanine esterification of teichoic acids
VKLFGIGFYFERSSGAEMFIFLETWTYLTVTGGNRGIGLALSQACADSGAAVGIVYNSLSPLSDFSLLLFDLFGRHANTLSTNNQVPKMPQIVRLRFRRGTA